MNTNEPKYLSLGNSMHLITWNNGEQCALLNDSFVPCGNIEEMTTQEAEDAISKIDGFDEELRKELLRRVKAVKKATGDWMISREMLNEFIEKFGIEKTSYIMYMSIKYFAAKFENENAPVPHMETSEEDEALQRLIKEQNINV